MKSHNFTIHRTRYENIGYFRLEPGYWQFIDLQDRTPDDWPSQIGEFYRTKAELLADLDRYAKTWGY